MEIDDIYNIRIDIKDNQFNTKDFASNFQIKYLALPRIDEVKLGEVLIQHKYIGIDSSIQQNRNKLSLEGPQIGIVLFSRSATLEVGDIIYANLLFSRYSIVSEDVCKKLDIQSDNDALKYLTLFGSQGRQVQNVMKLINRNIKENDNIVITNATSAVGYSLVQMIKQNYKNQIITIVTNDEQESLMKLHTNMVINLQKNNYNEQLKEQCKPGIKILIDGMGGSVLNTCLNYLSNKAQIFIIGNLTTYTHELTNIQNLISTSSSMIGLDIDQDQLIEQYNPQNKQDIIVKISDGLDNSLRVINEVLSGQSVGFQIVRVLRVQEQAMLDQLKSKPKL